MSKRAAVLAVGVVCVAVVLTVGAAPPPSPQPVSVVNFPAVQPVSGTVNVGNLPAVQQVAGTVGVGNLPVDADGNLRVSVQGASSDYQVLSLLSSDVQIFPYPEYFYSVPFDVSGYQLVGVVFDADDSPGGVFAQIQWQWVDGGPFLKHGYDARGSSSGTYYLERGFPTFTFSQGRTARIAISSDYPNTGPVTVHSITVQLRK